MIYGLLYPYHININFHFNHLGARQSTPLKAFQPVLGIQSTPGPRLMQIH